MLGYTRDELLSLHVTDVHPDEMPKMAAFTQAVLAEGIGWTDELTCLAKGGEKLPTELSAAAVSSMGSPGLSPGCATSARLGGPKPPCGRAKSASGSWSSMREDLLEMSVWDVSLAMTRERFANLEESKRGIPSRCPEKFRIFRDPLNMLEKPPI